jgi:hypothetical protein
MVTLINAVPVALGAQRSTHLRQGRHRPRSSLPETDIMRHKKSFQVCVSHLPYTLCEKKQSDGVICKKQHVKHNMEKLCEKKKQHCSSMMPLLRLLEEIH